VILKKYSPIADLGEFAQEYADSLYESTRHVALIADQDEIVAVAGASRKSFYERRITEHVEEVMRNRKPFLSNSANENPTCRRHGIVQPGDCPHNRRRRYCGCGDSVVSGRQVHG